MWHVFVVHVALVDEPGLHEYALRPDVVVARDRYDRGAVQHHPAEPEEFCRDLGGESPTPVLRMQSVAQLHLIRAFDVEMPEHAASGHPTVGVPQHPEAETMVVPMVEVARHI